jgi:hypothetical protein
LGVCVIRSASGFASALQKPLRRAADQGRHKEVNAMPPSTFNKMEGNPNTDWDPILQAREMYLDGTSGAGAGSSFAPGVGQVALIAGGALLAIICIALALAVG